VGTVWQSAHTFHLPGAWAVPAEIGKYVSWFHDDGFQAVVVWQVWQSSGNAAAACDGLVVALYCVRWQAASPQVVGVPV
jgi:hypothetical protein